MTALTDLRVRRLEPQAEAYRVTDGAGLFLVVLPGGSKSWRCVYTLNAKRHLITLGTYPEMSLAAARAARQGVRGQVREGASPTHDRALARRERLDRNDMTFEVMAGRWHEYMARTEWSRSYGVEVLQRLANHAFPAFGKRPIDQVTRAEVIDLLQRVVMRNGHWQANHLRQHLVCAFDHWMDKELITRNPADRLAKKFRTPKKRMQPAVVTVEGARQVLALVDGSGAAVALRLLHRFLALTMVRPSEARELRWREVEGRRDVWTIPAERMKGRRGRQESHNVMLSPQAREVIAVAAELSPGHAPDDFVFPSYWTKHKAAPLHRSALSDMLDRVLADSGIKHVPHGWRAAFSTVMNERHAGMHRVIDRVLAHASKGQVEERYNRAQHETQARALAVEWANEVLAGAPSAWEVAGLAVAPPVIVREAA
jgi:integrase